CAAAFAGVTVEPSGVSTATAYAVELTSTNATVLASSTTNERLATCSPGRGTPAAWNGGPRATGVRGQPVTGPPARASARPEETIRAGAVRRDISGSPRSSPR